MLLCALVVLWRRHMAAYISAFKWQSVALGFVGLVVAWRGHVPELYIVAALLILVLKGVVVPRILIAMEAPAPAGAGIAAARQHGDVSARVGRARGRRL